MRGNPALDRSLRVLATRERVAELLREQVRANGVALALGLIDLRSLEDRLLRACELEPIGTTQARLAVAAVAPRAARGTSLAELSREPGFAESFLILWDTLRRAGLGPRDLERLAQRLAGGAGGRTQLSARRFAALARIASAYEEQLRRRRVVDGVGARARLPERLGELGEGRLLALLDGARRIEVEASADVSVLRARLWEALARRGIAVVVGVPELPGAETNAESESQNESQNESQSESQTSELAAAFELARRNLVDEAPSVELLPEVLGADDGVLARVARMPFMDAARAKTLVNPELRSRLRLIEAGNERAELRLVCARIRELLHEGVPPHEICVAAPRLGLARARILAAFDAAQLPVEEARGQPVLHAAPLRLALALVEAAERDLPREGLAGVLESAYVARRDSAALLAALREAGSRDDRGIGHLGRLRAYAHKLTLPPPDVPAKILERRLEQSRRFIALADRWEWLFERLRLPAHASLRAHLDAVFAALRALGVPRRSLSLPALGQGARERRLERDAIAALARDRAALEALQIAGHGLDDAAEAVGVAEEAVSLTDFRAHLEAALSGVRERSPGVRGAGVRLLDLGELARSSSAHTFILHAVEGSLPGAGRAIPFLDDDDRAALDRAAGRSVLAGARATGADAGSFALACARTRSSLVISCHRQDHGGREVGRSRYFAALADAVGEEGQTFERHEAQVVPSLAQCSTRGQVLTKLVAREVAKLGSARTREADAGVAERAPLDPLSAVLGSTRGSIELPQLRRAVDWTRARSEDPGRARVALGAGALAQAHDRLDFDWEGRVRERETPPSPPGRVWSGSVTALEDYAACPFRFFAARVLRLRPRPSSRDELDASEQGDIRHWVLAEVMEVLRREGLTPLRGGGQAGRESRRARELCDGVLDTWEERRRTGPGPFWLLHRDLVHRDLGRLLEGERRVAVEGWEPGEFEVGFGLPDPAQSPEELAAGAPVRMEGVPLAIPDRSGTRRLELVGRVDRVDYRGDGRDAEGLIIDYKSGRVGERLRYDKLGRTQLQLAVYATWLASIRMDLSYTDAAYVSLRDGERSRASLLDLSLSSMELDGLLELDPTARAELRARDLSGLEAGGGEGQGRGAPELAVGALDLPETGPRNLADNLWALLGGVAAGRFDVRPHDPGLSCRYCPYGPVCRVERGDEEAGG